MTRKYRAYPHPQPDESWVYAYTDNGREIREGKVDGKSYYWVQPEIDNYWLCVGSPAAALKAYARPDLFVVGR